MGWNSMNDVFEFFFNYFHSFVEYLWMKKLSHGKWVLFLYINHSWVRQGWIFRLEKKQPFLLFKKKIWDQKHWVLVGHEALGLEFKKTLWRENEILANMILNDFEALANIFWLDCIDFLFLWTLDKLVFFVRN